MEFYDCDDFGILNKSKVGQVYGVCFYGDKLVLGLSNNGEWNLLGGKPEPGEGYLQTLERELIEEGNLKLLKAWLIGYQYIKEEDTIQLRYACKVDKIGEFKSDPAGGITKIIFINPKNYKKYLKWGRRGDHLVNKATQLVLM